MKREHAKKIAETISNEQILNMIETAKTKIKNWNKRSIINKGLSKGTAWNILASDFDITKEHHILYKINLIREYGEFLPDEFKPKKVHKDYTPPVHQEPKF